MNITRRHLLAATGGLAAAGTLAACGNNSGGVTTSNPPSSGGGSGAKPTLSQWYHEYGEAGVQDAVKKYAAAYPDATVNVQWNPGEGYMQKVTAALLTNKVPDVFESENGATLDMIQNGQVADLTELIAPVKDKFNASVLKRFTFNDKVYSIPQVIDMQLLYYRPSLLKAKNIQPPKTFAELTAAAEALTTADMGGFFAGNKGGTDVLATMFIWASGNSQLNDGRTEANFLNDNFYAALKAYQTFYKSKGLLKSASKDWFDGGPIANGETAMQWGGLWSMPDIKKALGDDFGVLPFPAMGASGKQAVPFGAFGSCVAAKGVNPDAAKKFVKWLWIDQTDKQVDFANAYGTHIPAQNELVAKCDKISSGPGADAAAYVKDLGQTNDIMWTGPLGDAYSSAVTNVIVKGADPATEFKSVGEKAKSELARVKG